MPIFKSEKEAQEVHRDYIYDTDEEGKFRNPEGQSGFFTPGTISWNRIKQLIDWIPNNQPIILEVGCNSGGLLRGISRNKPGCVLYGIEINPRLVERAISKGIIAKEGMAEQLPYENSFFDVVILSELLEHLYSPEKGLEEAMRVLKQGGLIIGSVPHPLGINATKRPIEEHLYHMRVFTKQSLKKLLSVLGDLKIVNIYHQPNITKKPQWMAFRGRK